MRAACLASVFWIAGISMSAAETRMRLHFPDAAQEFALDDPQSRAGFTRFMSVDAVSFEGVAGAARLVVQLSLPPGGAVPHDARILFLPDGWRDYWVSPLVFPEGGVVVEALALTGTAPRIAGRFDVDLCFTRSPMHLPDMDKCHRASGDFATGLVAE